MKELDKLVENYFTEKKAPELGMDMLLEMVEQSLEEMAVDSFGDPDLQDILINFLRQYSTKPKEMIKEATTGKTLHLTHFGSAIERNIAIQALKKHLDKNYPKIDLGEEVKYARNDSLSVGLVVGNSRVLLFDGRTHTKENINFKLLENVLMGIQNSIKADENKEIDIHFYPKDGSREEFKDIDISVVEQIGKKGGKADFVIGRDGENQIFISHKDGGEEPKLFGQYSGVTGEAFYKTKDVEDFKGIIIKILSEEFGLEEYPSNIDFQQRINDVDIIMKAIFGIDWENGKESSEDNVDYLIQGPIDLKILHFFGPEEEPGKEETKNRIYEIGGNVVLSKRVAQKKGKDAEALIGSGYFPSGYEPVLATRRGDKRANFGKEIKSLRASVQATGGRKVNFILAKDSTPANIQFEEHTLDRGQYKKAMNFLEDIKPRIAKKQSAMVIWNKMFNSINPEETP
jgi:hypothetical protein